MLCKGPIRTFVRVSLVLSCTVLAGGLVATAVAIICALFSDDQPGSSRLISEARMSKPTVAITCQTSEGLGLSRLNLSGTDVLREHPDYYLRAFSTSMRIPSQAYLGRSPQETTSESQYYSVNLTMAGWPRRCLWCRDATVLSADPHNPTRLTTWHWGIPIETGPGAETLAIPLAVLWGGFLLNATLYGAILFICAVVTLGRIRRRRRRRGACAACGYDLRGGTGLPEGRACPECGTVPRQSIAVQGIGGASPATPAEEVNAT
jgi:hypothetical protein